MIMPQSYCTGTVPQSHKQKEEEEDLTSRQKESLQEGPASRRDRGRGNGEADTMQSGADAVGSRGS